MLRVIFENPSRKKKAQQQGQERVGKQVAKPLDPSGMNNGSQTHEINKWVLKRQVGLKKLKKREMTYSWTIYDVEKGERANAGPK